MPAHMTLKKPAKGTATKARRARKRAADAILARNAVIVRDRDGDRCRVCRSSEGVEVHHIVYRSRGGGHATSNLACLCARCHRKVHAGTLRLSGNADRELVSMEGRGTVFAALDGILLRVSQNA